MSARIRWLLGSAAILITIILIVYCPISSMLSWQSNFLARCFFTLLLCLVFCLYRVLMGPTAPDRIVAVDILGIMIVGFCAILSIPTGRDWYIDIGIAWSLQSFIGTLALAKYLEGKDFDE